jgi:Ca2+-transporting ATPase
MFNNKLFIMVIISMTVLQTTIVFVGGVAFSVTRLTAVQWIVSIVLGALTLPVGALIRCIPEWPIRWMIDSARRRRRTEQASSSSYDSTNVISPI